MKKILLISALSAMTLSCFVEIAEAAQSGSLSTTDTTGLSEEAQKLINQLSRIGADSRNIDTFNEKLQEIAAKYNITVDPLSVSRRSNRAVGEAMVAKVDEVEKKLKAASGGLATIERLRNSYSITPTNNEWGTEPLSLYASRANSDPLRGPGARDSESSLRGVAGLSDDVIFSGRKTESVSPKLWAAVTKCYFSSKFDVDGKDLRHLKLVEELLKLKDELQQTNSDDKTKPFIGELQGLLAKLEIRFFENDNGDVVEIINNCFEITPDKRFENKQVENLRDKLKKLKGILSSDDPFELKTIHTDGKWRQLAEQKEILRKAYELCQLLEKKGKRDFDSISEYCSTMEKNDAEAWNKLHRYGEADQKFVKTKEDEYLSRPWVQQNAVEQAIELVKKASKEKEVIDIELYITKDGFSLMSSNE